MLFDVSDLEEGACGVCRVPSIPGDALRER